MRSEVRKLKKNTVQAISFYLDTPGPEVEEVTIEGFWTGEIDSWGKLTIRPINGTLDYYLFDREIIGVEEYEGGD